MEKKCNLCRRDITLKTNLSGLVYDDKFFLCEDCNENHSNEEINTWKESVMKNPTSGMPISLWLIHEQNKNKTFMTKTSMKND